MLKIRRPLGRLIFNMGIAIPGKTVFLIETAPRWSNSQGSMSYIVIMESIYWRLALYALLFQNTVTFTIYWLQKWNNKHLQTNGNFDWNKKIRIKVLSTWFLKIPNTQLLKKNPGERNIDLSNQNAMKQVWIWYEKMYKSLTDIRYFYVIF